MKRVKSLIWFIVLVMCMSTALAALEITQDASRLNYWTAQSHIVTVENTGALDTNVTISSTWTVTATDGVYCTEPETDEVQCIVANGESGTYTITSDASVGEYATTAFTASTNNTYTAETVTFVRVKDEEILRTLVEYGRGRGNYFYDSGTTNRKGEQCTDLPANTALELNYLHKVFPVINNYLNIPSAEGTDVELYCEYPNASTTKQHLASSIVQNPPRVEVNYTSDWLKNSWEKVFFLVQDFDEGEKSVGDIIEVNCSTMKYYLDDANGWVAVDADSFALNFQDATPFTVSASSSPSSIGTGTSEVAITYTITNGEDIVISSSTNPVTIDIKAPPQSEFIGTRGELWGSALDSYRYELNSIGPNEELNITLVARFDTDGTTPLNLSEGVSISFIPCWQVNAYNPLTTEQNAYVGDTITVTGDAASVTSIQTQLSDIESNVTDTNTRVRAIETVVTDINTTVNYISGVVDSIQTDTTNILIDTGNILTDTGNILTDTGNLLTGQTTIIGYVDDVETNQATMIEYLLQINGTTTNVNSVVNQVWTALQQVNATSNLIYNNTQDTYNYLQNTIYNYLDAINATTDETNVIVKQLNDTANSIEVIVTDTNTTANEINVVVNDINTTVNAMSIDVDGIVSNVTYIVDNIWNGTTAADILSGLQQQNYTARFDTIDSSMATLTTNLRQLEEFEEESIYLITDSITEGQNAYKEALVALDDGDAEVALSKLQESVDLLVTARDGLEDLQLEATKTPIETMSEEEQLSLIDKLLLWLSRLFK